MAGIINFEKKVIRIFRKNGNEGQTTKIFLNLSPTAAKSLLNSGVFETRELPIIVGGNFDATFFVLTNRRIMKIVREKIESMVLEQIIEIRVPQRSVRPLDKENWSTLQTVGTDGQVLSIEIESGGPFFGVLNVLQFVVAHNRP